MASRCGANLPGSCDGAPHPPNFHPLPKSVCRARNAFVLLFTHGLYGYLMIFKKTHTFEFVGKLFSGHGAISGRLQTEVEPTGI